MNRVERVCEFMRIAALLHRPIEVVSDYYTSTIHASVVDASQDRVDHGHRISPVPAKVLAAIAKAEGR
jgi:hypothetical protein